MRAAGGELPKAKSSVTWRTAFRQFIWPRRKNVLIGLVLILVGVAAVTVGAVQGRKRLA